MRAADHSQRHAHRTVRPPGKAGHAPIARAMAVAGFLAPLPEPRSKRSPITFEDDGGTEFARPWAMRTACPRHRDLWRLSAIPYWPWQNGGIRMWSHRPPVSGAPCPGTTVLVQGARRTGYSNDCRRDGVLRANAWAIRIEDRGRREAVSFLEQRTCAFKCGPAEPPVSGLRRNDG